MKNVAAFLILIALVALGVMSLAPPEWVGARSGLGSPAGVVTALALLVVVVAGGWLWLGDKRKKK